MALKLYHDHEKYSLAEFSALAGITKDNLLQMEILLLLEVFGSSLLIKSEEFDTYRQRLLNLNF
jgi:hypothetical protein